MMSIKIPKDSGATVRDAAVGFVGFLASSNDSKTIIDLPLHGIEWPL